MHQHVIDENLAELRRVCQKLGCMDDYDALRLRVIDEVHSRGNLRPFDAEKRRRSYVFVNKHWVEQAMKRISRGPDPDLDLFNEID